MNIVLVLSVTVTKPAKDILLPHPAILEVVAQYWLFFFCLWKPERFAQKKSNQPLSTSSMAI